MGDAGSRRLAAPSDGQRVGRLDLFHHRVGARLAHARQAPDDRGDHLAVGSHVGHAGLDQVVEAAGHQVALEDLGPGLDGRLEGVHDVRRGAIEQHLDEHHHAGAQLVRVQPGFVAEDEVLARQALHALEHRRGRQVHLLGELQVADAAVALQHAQDAGVDLVDSLVGREIRHRRRFGLGLVHAGRISGVSGEIRIYLVDSRPKLPDYPVRIYTAMSSSASPFVAPPQQARLPYPYRPEVDVVEAALATLTGQLDWPQVIRAGRPWVEAVREKPAPFWAMESLLREYPISSAEGLALMRLAEALLRVPDVETAIALTADQLGRAEFDADSVVDGPHKMLAGISASAISLSKKFLPDADGEGGLLKRLGAKTVVAATVRAIQLLGRQFVLGRTIEEAMDEAKDQRKDVESARRGAGTAASGLRFSYDMLGEGARTEHDAERYLASYANAIQAISRGQVAASPENADGISIKLSALFSRYEDAQHQRVFAELLPRVWTLVELAANANLNLTIDAEETDRLELSLDVLDALAGRIAAVFPQWQGFGLAVQAYQTRALQVVDAVAAIARKHKLRFMVRLVKGAYWDGEIKRAQEGGLAGYPVFTHKEHTDISYLACARALIGHADVIYPQFATHNAGTIAAILQMARARGAAFEMQRLHGMGEGVYREVMKDKSVACRVYAPVGEHRDLLAYLVRRLLENGANSSFVHQLADTAVGVEQLLVSPLAPPMAPAFPLPADLYPPVEGRKRRNSTGA